MSSIYEALKKFIPPNTFQVVEPHLVRNNVHLKISKPRKSKLGDYRAPLRKDIPHKISVNNNLNQFAFLVTLVHEIAHMYNFKTYGHKVAPHGVEWKSYFRQLLVPHIQAGVFPENINKALINYMENPAASSCTDENLYLALESHNPLKLNVIRVGDLKPGERFIFRNRLFEVEHKLRKRYSCFEIGTHKKYYFSALAEVTPTND
ncbi:MAG: SprT-like domain-containing protein [Bacteroidia bacterium]